MRIKLYHLTPTKNRDLILKEGIKANKDHMIFVFTDMLVANEIAKNQVFTDRYCVFKIARKGIESPLLKDNVGEFSAWFHRIVKQDCIEPQCLKLVCEQDTIYDKPTTWDYLVHGRFYNRTREQVDRFFEIMTWAEEQEKKDELSHEKILEEVNRRLEKV
ncbi:MAG TPA: hypothetical protein PKL48_09580 [Thermodesulfobacteriota bacterium]|nr:hypothetical protein [Thermodesulfobacteriota bacterium]